MIVACCNESCVARETSGYTSKCNTDDYIFHTTVADYCSSYCTNNRTFNTYQVSSVNATETQCCNSRFTAKNIGNIADTGQGVCDSTHTWHTDKITFCGVLYSNTSLTINSCDGNTCTNETECCVDKCKTDNPNDNNVCIGEEWI